MKLLAREFRLIKDSGCDWNMMVKFISSVKKAFPNSLITGIEKTEPSDRNDSVAMQMHYCDEVDRYATFTKGGAPMRKKSKALQTSLPLGCETSGLNER